MFWWGYGESCELDSAFNFQFQFRTKKNGNYGLIFLQQSNQLFLIYIYLKVKAYIYLESLLELSPYSRQSKMLKSVGGTSVWTLLPTTRDGQPSIMEYPFARNVWALVKGSTQKSNNATQDFFLHFKQMRKKLSSLERERWAIIS